MLVSIIVPAFNEAKLLGSSLEAIRAATVAWTKRGWSFELIVCDNNSTDETAAIARAHGAEVVFEPINQIARARNRGASIARGRWLVFVDADSRPSPELLDDLAAAIASDQFIACGATFEFDEGSAWLRFLGACWLQWSRLLRHMAGSFVAVEAQAFREVGGFSEDLFAGEELDLSHRLQALGRDRMPRQTIRILHRHPLVTSGRKARLYGWRETLGFGLQSLVNPRRAMRSRDRCALWYDGRR